MLLAGNGSACEDDAEDGLGAGRFEDAGAFFEGGTGRSDIVDEPDGFAVYHCFASGSERKSVFQIAEAGFTRFGFDLGLGVADAEQAVLEDWQNGSGSERFGEGIGEELGLIETTETQAPFVKWDGYEHVREGQIYFQYSFCEPRTEGFRESGDEAVFVGMDGRGNQRMTVVRCDKESVEGALSGTGKTDFTAGRGGPAAMRTALAQATGKMFEAVCTEVLPVCVAGETVDREQRIQ